MALADFDAFRGAVADPTAVTYLLKVPAVAGQNTDQFFHYWTRGLMPPAGTAPTTAVAYADGDAGSIPHPTGSRVILVGAATGVGASTVRTKSARAMLVDRLSAQGGLSGNINTTQTTNLPTAALTRHTSGVGVMLMLRIDSDLGTTDTVVTASYTNTASTSGRTATVVLTASPLGGHTQFFSLQAGDLGVKSVESVTLSAATGTVGAFGVTLVKPLALLAPGSPSGNMRIPTDFAGWNVNYGDACLEMLYLSGDVVFNRNPVAFLAFSEA